MSYFSRDVLLNQLGYASYAVYLASPLWAKIRKGVLQGTRYHCRLCRERATEVHHISYSRDALLGKNHALLVAICHPCHQLLEFDIVGCKRKQADVEAVTRYELYRSKKHGKRKAKSPVPQCYKPQKVRGPRVATSTNYKPFPALSRSMAPRLTKRTGEGGGVR